MHRGKLLALMIPLLLCSCGTEPEETELAGLRETMEGSTITLSADITRYGEDTLFACSEEVTWSGGAVSAVLTAPDTIAGVSFRTGEEDTLEYDGAILSLGDGVEAPSPAMAVPRVMAALQKGRVLYTGRDRESRFIVFAEDGGGTVTVTFSGETGSPVYAEITEDNTVVLTVRITGWQAGGQV